MKTYECVEVKRHKDVAKRLTNGKRMGGSYTPTPALNTESAVTLTTTYCLKKANRR